MADGDPQLDPSAGGLPPDLTAPPPPPDDAFGGDPFLQWYHRAPPAPVVTPPPADASAPTASTPDASPGLPPPAAPPPPGALPDAITSADRPTLPPEPAAVPDAISGGGLPGPVANAKPSLPNEYLMPDEQDQKEGERIANLPPEEQAKIATQRQQAYDNELARRKLEASQHDLAQQQANFFQQQQAWMRAQDARNKLEADAAALAATKIDPDRWWNSRSTGQKIAGVFAAFASGFTGNNGGLSMIKDAIDRDVDAQKSDLANRRAGLSFRRELAGDQEAQDLQAFHESEVFRQASYNRVVGDLQAQMQNFDPHGTAALRYAQAINGVRQMQAQSASAYQQQVFKQTNEAYKSTTDRMKVLEEQRKNMADEALKAAKAGGAGAGAGVEAPVYGTVYKSLNDVPKAHVANAFPLPSINGQPGGYAVAGNPEDKKDATHLVEMYEQARYDGNELKRISLERDGAKSAGGAAWKKWQDTNEQHYEQLLVDLANVYGMMIHGRAPTSGVLEEVMTKSAPELKSLWESGDTTKLLDTLENDITNRTQLRIGTYLGKQHTIDTESPRIDKPNLNTISVPMTAPPVKGDAGYARFDIANFGQGLDTVLQQYKDNPGLGDPDALAKQYNDIAVAQRKASNEIQADIARLEAKKKRSAADDAQLSANRLALKDRQEAIRETEEAKRRNVPALTVTRNRQAAPTLPEEPAARQMLHGAH